MNGPADDSLRTLLERLHERLSTADPVSPESRAMLATVTRDLQRALGSDAAAPGLVQPADREAVPRLEALAVRFEADHPALAQGLRQLIDLLGKAGI
jgi:predicted component of type VI protein secretion system